MTNITHLWGLSPEVDSSEYFAVTKRFAAFLLMACLVFDSAMVAAVTLPARCSVSSRSDLTQYYLCQVLAAPALLANNAGDPGPELRRIAEHLDDSPSLPSSSAAALTDHPMYSAKTAEPFTLKAKGGDVFEIVKGNESIGSVFVTPQDDNSDSILITLNSRAQGRGISDAICRWIAQRSQATGRPIISKVGSLHILQSIWRHSDNIAFEGVEVQTDGTVLPEWQPITYSEAAAMLERNEPLRVRVQGARPETPASIDPRERRATGGAA